MLRERHRAPSVRGSSAGKRGAEISGYRRRSFHIGENSRENADPCQDEEWLSRPQIIQKFGCGVDTRDDEIIPFYFRLLYFFEVPFELSTGYFSVLLFSPNFSPAFPITRFFRPPPRSPSGEPLR